MKHLLMIAAAVFCTLFVTSLRPGKVQKNQQQQAPVERQEDMDARHKQLSPQKQARIARRQARQAEYEHFMDSVIMSHNYRFIPQSFSRQPAGSSQIITNPNCELGVYSDYADIFLPYYKGITPPYRLVLLNTIVNYFNGYTAVQNENGWTITFSSWLYSANDYTFTLDVYSKTGSAQLSVTNTFYNTVSYWGYVTAVY